MWTRPHLTHPRILQAPILDIPLSNSKTHVEDLFQHVNTSGALIARHSAEYRACARVYLEYDAGLLPKINEK